MKQARLFLLVFCLWGFVVADGTDGSRSPRRENTYGSGSCQPEWPVEALLFSPGQVSDYQPGPIEGPRVDSD